MKQKRRGGSDSETPEAYYWRIFDAKKNKEEWARDIPLDMTTFRSINGRCWNCGCPPEKMDGCFNPSECKKCGILRLMKLCGYSEEDALKMYENREKRKEYSMKFYEMARRKKIGNTERSEIEDPEKLPF